MSSETENDQSLRIGVQISSEILVPGGSNLIKGDFRQAGIHVGLGFIARALFGLPGAVLVSLNSIAKATTGRHLHEHLTAPAGTQAQRVRATPSRKAAEITPSQKKKTPLDAPSAPDYVTLTPTEKPLPAKRSRTKSATKRRKASGG